MSGFAKEMNILSIRVTKISYCLLFTFSNFFTKNSVVSLV